MINDAAFLSLHFGCRKCWLKNLIKKTDINGYFIVFKCYDNDVFQKEHINLLQDFLISNLGLKVNVSYNAYNTNALAA